MKHDEIMSADEDFMYKRRTAVCQMWPATENDGRYLCRTCHDAINGQRTDGELDSRAQKLGLRNKYNLQIMRLALRERAALSHNSFQELTECLQAQYNVTQTPAHT